MTDLEALWDFDDPAASELRFREAAEATSGAERVVLMTQVVRSLGLQGRYDEGHALLDELIEWDRRTPDETAYAVAARFDLERGRLFRSAGELGEASAYFAAAETLARQARDAALEIDAVHMQALLAAPAEAIALDKKALGRARSSEDSAARAWEASLLNNLGCALVDAGSLEEALATFEEAVAVRERRRQHRETQIARWMVGWTLRLLGRTNEALAVQQSLKTELDAEGATDAYVDEELALLQQR
jgi:tetratricopeptide (TPR) repeat protein